MWRRKGGREEEKGRYRHERVSDDTSSRRYTTTSIQIIPKDFGSTRKKRKHSELEYMLKTVLLGQIELATVVTFHFSQI